EYKRYKYMSRTVLIAPEYEERDKYSKPDCVEGLKFDDRITAVYHIEQIVTFSGYDEFNENVKKPKKISHE
ncbi:hypothetical protein CHS0354_009186, partial [Potamilus streckersoni]